MANLNRLMTLGGAVAAGEFSADGGLVSYKGDFPRRRLATSQRCARARLSSELPRWLL